VTIKKHEKFTMLNSGEDRKRHCTVVHEPPELGKGEVIGIKVV